MTFLGRIGQDIFLPYVLVVECMFFLGVFMNAVSRQIAIKHDFDKLFALFASGNADIAMRASQLNVIDPDYTDKVISAAEEALPLILTKGYTK